MNPGAVSADLAACGVIFHLPVLSTEPVLCKVAVDRFMAFDPAIPATDSSEEQIRRVFEDN